MAVVVPDEGELELLGLVKTGIAVDLILVQTDFTLDEDTVYADVTGVNKADFSGYADIPLTGADFDAPSTVSNVGTLVATSFHTFTHDGGVTGNTIYGYALVDSGNSKLYWAEKFGTPRVVEDENDAVSVKPKLTLNSEN